MWKELKRIIKPNGAIVLFGSEPFSSALRMSNIKRYKYDWIWENPHTGQLNAKIMPLKSYESISVFNAKAYNPQFSNGEPYEVKRVNYKGSEAYGAQKDHSTKSDGKRYPKQILSFKHDKNRLHPTQKPVALLEYLIKTYTQESETVLDFTMGSGSTGVACVNTNRNFIGIEMDDNYFNIAKNRITEAQNVKETS